MLAPHQFEWITFDCYGTLIDWESGICDAVSEVIGRHGVHKSNSELLTLFSKIEPKIQGAPGYLKYREVLRRVMDNIGTESGLRLSDDELSSLPESMVSWRVFPDTCQALNILKTRYKLAVISNVDDDLFVSTVKALNVDLDLVVTAEQVRNYKPNLRNFKAALACMDIDKQNWLHVAESLYHDIGPANRLGIKSVWVKRPNRGGGTRPTDAIPDVVVSDLAELTRMLCPDLESINLNKRR